MSCIVEMPNTLLAALASVAGKASLSLSKEFKVDLNLHQRTVVILGPIGPTIQNLVMNLSQHGADIALIDAEAAKMQKFCQAVTDQREMNEKFGRATAIPVQWDNLSSLKDAIGK